MSFSRQSAVLVTGASTGIGRATAVHLAARGYRVFAGVRSITDAPPATTPLILDLTDAGCIAAASDLLADENLAAVINNAGYNYFGAV